VNTPSGELVSVVIPAYNRAAVIGRALGSALRQTHTNLEIIVVDDGSTDATASVIEDLYDPRVRYLRQANQGAPAARNRGIREASGEFVAFLDSDDEWHPEKIARQVRAYRGSPSSDVGAVACGSTWIDAGTGYQVDRGSTLSGRVFQRLLALESVSGGSSLLVHRSVLAGVSWDERFKALQDREFALALAAKCSFETVAEPMVKIYRNHGGEHVMSPARAVASLHLIRDRYTESFEARPELDLLYEVAATAYWAEAGDFAKARGCLRAAIAMAPSEFQLYLAYAACSGGPRGTSVVQRVFRRVKRSVSNSQR
jgi:glycosyltransferase involved in cell wall biosynthesis